MIEALGPRLCIQPDKMDDDPLYKAAKSAGIVIPETESERVKEMSIDQGVVLNIGQSAFVDFKTEPWCVVGDKIAYARHAGKWVTDPDNGNRVLIINDEDVVCRITKKETKDV